MKLYKEVSQYSVTKLFKKLDALKSYLLESKDTCDSLIAVYEYNVKAINDEINSIMFDQKKRRTNQRLVPLKNN